MATCARCVGRLFICPLLRDNCVSDKMYHRSAYVRVRAKEKRDNQYNEQEVARISPVKLILSNSRKFVAIG